MREGLAGADIVMMLRLQRERMNGSFVPSTQEYFAYYGLDQKKLAYAKPDALVMHPGPMNRGVEIDSHRRRRRAVADPRAGRDGRRRAHGGAGSAVAQPAERVNHACVVRPPPDPARQRPDHRSVARPRFPRRPADRRRRDPRGQARHRRGRRAGRHRDRRLPRPHRGARPDRHARLRRRARRRAPRDASPPRARPRRPAASPPSSASPTPTPAIDDPAIVDFVLRRARDTAHRPRASDGRADQGPRRARR